MYLYTLLNACGKGSNEDRHLQKSTAWCCHWNKLNNLIIKCHSKRWKTIPYTKQVLGKRNRLVLIVIDTRGLIAFWHAFLSH